MSAIKVLKRNNVGQLVEYNVIQGQSELNKNYFDQDAYDIEFSNAGGLKRMFKSVRKRKDAKAASKNKLRDAKAKSKIMKADAKQTGAKAQVEAAKGLASDSSSTISPSLSESTTPKKSNTLLIVGIIAGVLVLGVGGYFLLKKKKK